MKLAVKRFADNGKATLSVFYINGVAYCFGVEDEERDVKVSGETRVLEGIYPVTLRSEGGYHNRETARYKDEKPNFHKGMLCISNAPNWVLDCGKMKFQYVLIHPGNTEKHTAACYLPNLTASFKTFEGGSSRDAYEIIYPIIRDAILSGEKVTIEYIDIEDGK